MNVLLIQCSRTVFIPNSLLQLLYVKQAIVQRRKLSALMDTIVRAKPAAAKGVYIRNVALSSSMGPGVTIDTTPFR